MLSSKISAVLVFVVLCSNYLQYSHQAMQVVTRSHVIEKSIFFANRHSFNEGNLVYVICDSNTKPTTKCKVVQENFPYKEIANSCHLTLENHGNNGFLTVVVVALGKDKAVLIWKYANNYHSTTITIGIIDLQTCSMNRVKIPNPAVSLLLELHFLTKFVSYDDDSFDIFYNDPRSQGVDAPLYKMHVNGDGQMKVEPRFVNVERGRYLFVSSVASGSPYKGHVFEGKHLMDLSKTPKYYLWLVKPDGTRKHLSEYNGFPRSGVSAGNNFIGLCYKPVSQPLLYNDGELRNNNSESGSKLENDIVCTQYDENGHILFATTLTGTRYDIDTLTSYNLLDGGMLIMFGAKRHSRETVFEVVRIDSEGTKVGSLITQHLEIPAGMMRNTYIYKNGNKGYCSTVIVANATSGLSLKEEFPTQLTIVANCFNDYDLSVWS